MHYLARVPGHAGRARPIRHRSPRAAAAHDPWRYQDLRHRRRADGTRRHRARRDDLPHGPRVSLALRDVRPLALHDSRTTRRAGAIPAQIEARAGALAGSAASVITRVKLYNASNFFDPARRARERLRRHRAHHDVGGLEQVIVESHPSLIGERVDRFLEALGGRAPRSRHGPRDRASGRARRAQQAHDRRRLRATPRRCCDAAACRSASFCSSRRRSCRAEEQDDWLLALRRVRRGMRRVRHFVDSRRAPATATMEALTAQKLFVAADAS